MKQWEKVLVFMEENPNVKGVRNILRECEIKENYRQAYYRAINEMKKGTTSKDLIGEEKQPIYGKPAPTKIYITPIYNKVGKIEGQELLCFFCERRSPLHRHHILPTIEGGKDKPSNFMMLCPTCHWQIHQYLQFYNNNKKRRFLPT